jgi:N-acetylmuramoyl-L-alanine amidase
MNSLVYYLLQVIVSSGILYLYYHAFLRNKRFHQYNRFYLLGSVVMSILIPFLHIPVHFTQEETTSSVVVRTLTILSSPQDAMLDNTGLINPQVNSSVHTIDLVYCFYALIAGLALVRIIIGLLRIKRLGSGNPVEKLGNIKFVNTNDSQAPFSFFNWLFWNRDIELKSEKGEQVFRHELFHIRQKHSLDIVFLEIASMIFWINPFFHLIKKETRAIHEFLADQYALDKGGQWNYAETLLMHALQTKHSLVNPFFHNQIKRRIAMITNPQKTSYQYLRKLLVLPVAAIVVTLFAFNYRKEKPVQQEVETPITVIIDAGHGGIDPGAYSPDNQFNEADLTLSLAKTVQQLASEYNIKVVMTREDDKLPGGAITKDDGLRKRVEISNAINPKIFISLHMNVSGGPKGFQQHHSGFEAYVTNRRQDDPGKAAASVLLQEMSKVYKTATDLKFRQDLGIYVLDKNKCATVLLQCGYINNRKDLDFINNKDNQEKLARSILRGIVSYNKKLAFQPAPIAMPADDSLPKKYNIKRKINADTLLRNQDTDPLIIVDGKILPRGPLSEEQTNTLSYLDPRTIEKVDVLKGQSAIDLYGEKGKNGVIVITLRKNFPTEKKDSLTAELTVKGN